MISEQRQRELAFLERVVRATVEVADHDELLRSIVDETTEATDTQVCSLYLWDEDAKVLVLTATNGLAQHGVGRVRLGLGEGVTGWVAAHRQSLVVPDVRDEPRFIWVSGLDQERFTSMLSVPIVLFARAIGVFNVQTVEPHHFGDGEVRFLETLAAQVAGIIELSALRQRLAHQLELERKAVQRLTALDASKSDLLAMLSHDFRGPLSIARSFAHGLSERLPGGSERDAVRELDAELDGLQRLVDNLMLSLELEAQYQLVLDREAFDLAELMQIVCGRLQRGSARHSIVLEAGENCVVIADRSKVQSVLVNLIGNALKYSPGGGTIRVTLASAPEIVEIGVQDEGIGLNARDVDTIFERYGRGDAALREGIRGHGLGLFICRQIVEAHGGSIFARALARGSSFTFTLPRR